MNKMHKNLLKWLLVGTLSTSACVAIISASNILVQTNQTNNVNESINNHSNTSLLDDQFNQSSINMNLNTRASSDIKNVDIKYERNKQNLYFKIFNDVHFVKDFFISKTITETYQNNLKNYINNNKNEFFNNLNFEATKIIFKNNSNDSSTINVEMTCIDTSRTNVLITYGKAIKISNLSTAINSKELNDSFNNYFGKELNNLILNNTDFQESCFKNIIVDFLNKNKDMFPQSSWPNQTSNPFIKNNLVFDKTKIFLQTNSIGQYFLKYNENAIGFKLKDQIIYFNKNTILLNTTRLKNNQINISNNSIFKNKINYAFAFNTLEIKKYIYDEFKKDNLFLNKQKNTSISNINVFIDNSNSLKIEICLKNVYSINSTLRNESKYELILSGFSSPNANDRTSCTIQQNIKFDDNLYKTIFNDNGFSSNWKNLIQKQQVFQNYLIKNYQNFFINLYNPNSIVCSFTKLNNQEIDVKIEYEGIDNNNTYSRLLNNILISLRKDPSIVNNHCDNVFLGFEKYLQEWIDNNERFVKDDLEFKNLLISWLRSKVDSVPNDWFNINTNFNNDVTLNFNAIIKTPNNDSYSITLPKNEISLKLENNQTILFPEMNWKINVTSFKTKTINVSQYQDLATLSAYEICNFKTTQKNFENFLNNNVNDFLLNYQSKNGNKAQFTNLTYSVQNYTSLCISGQIINAKTINGINQTITFNNLIFEKFNSNLKTSLKIKEISYSDPIFKKIFKTFNNDPNNRSKGYYVDWVASKDILDFKAKQLFNYLSIQTNFEEFFTNTTKDTKIKNVTISHDQKKQEVYAIIEYYGIDNGIFNANIVQQETIKIVLNKKNPISDNSLAIDLRKTLQDKINKNDNFMLKPKVLINEVCNFLNNPLVDIPYIYLKKDNANLLNAKFLDFKDQDIIYNDNNLYWNNRFVIIYKNDLKINANNFINQSIIFEDISLTVNQETKLTNAISIASDSELSKYNVNDVIFGYNHKTQIYQLLNTFIKNHWVKDICLNPLYNTNNEVITTYKINKLSTNDNNNLIIDVDITNAASKYEMINLTNQKFIISDFKRPDLASHPTTLLIDEISYNDELFQTIFGDFNNSNHGFSLDWTYENDINPTFLNDNEKKLTDYINQHKNDFFSRPYDLTIFHEPIMNMNLSLDKNNNNVYNATFQYYGYNNQNIIDIKNGTIKINLRPTPSTTELNIENNNSIFGDIKNELTDLFKNNRELLNNLDSKQMQTNELIIRKSIFDTLCQNPSKLPFVYYPDNDSQITVNMRLFKTISLKDKTKVLIEKDAIGIEPRNNNIIQNLTNQNEILIEFNNQTSTPKEQNNLWLWISIGSVLLLVLIIVLIIILILKKQNKIKDDSMNLID